MAYDLLKLFVFDFLCNEDIFASDDLQLLRHLGILSTEHWQDMKTYMTLSALGFRWMGEWRHILMRPVPEPVINCPVARDIRQSHRMNIQRHFREQRDRLMKPSKVTKEELRCLTSSTSEQWKIGIRETQHMLHGQSTPNTLEGIISCLMVAESMRLFGEEKETTPVSRDQIFDDFRVWRRLVPEEDRPLFDRISHAVWGISGLESADPCSISSGDCERVLPYLNKLVSSLVSSTADFILDEEDDVSGTEDGYTLRQIRRWFAKEPPSTEQLDYRRTRLKQELSPPPIEEIKLPDRVEKYKPARPEVVLIISTAIFAVIFAFLYLLQAVDTEEIEYFNACLSGLTGLEAHAIVLSIYLGVLSPAHMKPSSEPKSAKNTTCGKCGKVFSSTSNLGKHWRALCGSSGEMFSCRLQSEGCTYTCNRRDNMRLHEKTCSFRSMEIQDYEFEFGWQLEGFAEHMA
ncbi:hypothetical protein F4819DRAFT_363793 [Hypoxylon fuscum]|nr:hypothetical protein F4819DRAFT_363793 [Hypoxylon fuscum]